MRKRMVCVHLRVCLALDEHKWVLNFGIENDVAVLIGTCTLKTNDWILSILQTNTYLYVNENIFPYFSSKPLKLIFSTRPIHWPDKWFCFSLKWNVINVLQNELLIKQSLCEQHLYHSKLTMKIHLNACNPMRRLIPSPMLWLGVRYINSKHSLKFRHA